MDFAGESAALEFEPAAKGGASRARAHGDWTFRSLVSGRAQLARRLAQIRRRPPASVHWDLTGVSHLDDAGAVWLARAVSRAGRIDISPRHQQMLEQVSQGLLQPREPGRGFDPLRLVLAIGRAGLNFGGHLRDGVAMLGQLALDCAAFARRPRELPIVEISAGVFRSGVTALPVTMLVGFLVGIVLTYLSALQLQRYGADLLVINIVGVGVVRELGPMLASIIAAGRSGSAITAQLGVMRVTEEIEALSVMGVSITARLVLPKVLALGLAMPLVAFCTDVAALAGGMLVSSFTLGITPAAFLEALPKAVEVVNFWIGIGKSLFFGFAVAFVACHYGLRVLPNTDSLAVGVTRSVVSSITVVIILDAVFAIFLRNVG